MPQTRKRQPPAPNDVGRLAELFSLSINRIHQMAGEGIVQRTGRGEFDVDASVKKYISHLNSRTSRAAGVADERAALYRIKRQREELALERDMGSMVAMNDLLPSLQRYTADIGSLIDSLPEKYGPLLHAIEDQAGKISLLHEFTRELREALGGYEFSPPDMK